MTRLATAPLVARVEPIVGESLLSLLSRACRANVFTHLDGLLAQTGFERKAAFAPFTAFDYALPIASLLYVDPVEIESRLHPAVQGAVDKTLVWWGGIRMERRFIESRIRRVAPAALATSPHHRLSWTHRALTFCPETFQTLVSNCPSCGQRLGWNRTRGPADCEHCFTQLSKQDSPFAPDEMRPSLHAATRLISPDPEVRAKALARLPSPFSDWDPGEVFSAICELGVAAEHPGEGRGSVVSSLLSEGRMERLSPGVIGRGFDVVAHWPGSFNPVIAHTWSALRSVDPQASASLRHLGVLGRHIDGRLEETAFRALIRAHLPQAARAAGVPQKMAPTATASCERLTLTEAQSRFGVSKAVLNRLVPEGESCVSGRLGRGGIAMLDPVRLEKAVSALRSCVEPAAAAAKLGVPAYCLPAFVKRRLLKGADDPDAERLAGVEPLITRRSLEVLIRWLEQKPQTGTGDPTTVQRALARRFSPIAWAAVFEAIGRGKIALMDVDTFRKGGLSDRLIVDFEEVDAYLSTVRPQPVPRGDVTLNADAAGLVMGMPGIYVPELIEAEFIGAARKGRSWMILLRELIAFDRLFVVSTSREWAQVFGKGGRSFPLSDLPRGSEATRHLRICLRKAFDDIINQEGEQSSPPKSKPPPTDFQKLFPLLSASIEAKEGRALTFPTLPTFSQLQALSLSGAGTKTPPSPPSSTTPSKTKEVSPQPSLFGAALADALRTS